MRSERRERRDEALAHHSSSLAPVLAGNNILYCVARCHGERSVRAFFTLTPALSLKGEGVVQPSLGEGYQEGGGMQWGGGMRSLTFSGLVIVLPLTLSALSAGVQRVRNAQ